MQYKAHSIGGMLSGILTLSMLSYGLLSPEALVIVGSATLGGLLPDIDHKGSFLGSRLKPVSHVVSKTMGHRGATHSPIVLGLVLGTLHIVTGAKTLFFLGLLIGALSHVLLDSMTVSGVPLLYPLTKDKFSILPLRTGGGVEKVLTVLMALSIPLIIFRGFIPL